MNLQLGAVECTRFDQTEVSVIACDSAGLFWSGKARVSTFAREKALGVIPATAQLTPRPSEIPASDALPEAAKHVYRRLMENYSGFSTARTSRSAAHHRRRENRPDG